MRTATLRGQEVISASGAPVQVDFGQTLVVISGVERKAHYLTMGLPHSND